MRPINLAGIEAARVRLSGVIRATPALRSDALSGLLGREVWTKPEHLQRTGSFKIRGAYNHIAHLKEEHLATHVVAASAGNHAQGVALAASLLGMASTVYMPRTTALPKIEATRAYGAEVVIDLESVDDCIEEARTRATAAGGAFVPPFDDPYVIAGQGTIGLEIAKEAPEVQTVIVPVGGGGLIGGVALALKQVAPGVRVVGVQAAGAAAMVAALESGAPVRLEATHTMADGIALRSVSAQTLDLTQRYVDKVVTVSEEEISRAVLVLLERAKWVVEPAGAVALAALLAGKVPGNSPALVLLSGGNVDPLVLMRLIEHGLSAAGRYLRLRVLLDDRPGALAALSAAIAALGLNVLAVEHHRVGPHLALNEVEVLLNLETRDPSHRDEVVPALRREGFRADPVG
jgi:threonine dehydratase